MRTPEQFYASFDKAGFLKTALWTPSIGGPQQSAQVRYKATTQETLSGEALSIDYTIKYPVTVLVGLKRGETVTIDGHAYKVNESPRSELDGSVLEAKLSRS